MNKDIQALVKMVMESEELQAEFEKFETPEEAYELASKLQQGFTKEEFLEAVKGFEAFSGDITDEVLAAVAGGQGDVRVPETLTEVPGTVSNQVTGGVDTAKLTRANVVDTEVEPITDKTGPDLTTGPKLTNLTQKTAAI